MLGFLKGIFWSRSLFGCLLRSFYACANNHIRELFWKNVSVSYICFTGILSSDCDSMQSASHFSLHLSPIFIFLNYFFLKQNNLKVKIECYVDPIYLDFSDCSQKWLQWIAVPRLSLRTWQFVMIDGVKIYSSFVINHFEK